MKNKLKEMYQNGQQSIGTFLQLNASLSAEAVGIAGLDYFILDTEHSPADLELAVECIKGAEIHNITPLVRIKHIDRGNVLKMLDAGAKGLIIPGVKSVEEVKELIRYGKYTPLGERGFCPTRCCDYGYNDAMPDGIKAYTEMCNQETMIIPQCETPGCLEHIEEIVALEGVDGIFVGPFDLSLSLGKPAMFDDPEVKAAFDKVLSACKNAKKPVFIFAPNAAAAKLRLEQGYDSITYSADLNIVIDSYKAFLSSIR